MRNLTILRRKKAAAALGKMKVYIEDPFSNELDIKDVPCRKLGELKNGVEKKTKALDIPVLMPRDIFYSNTKKSLILKMLNSDNFWKMN